MKRINLYFERRFKMGIENGLTEELNLELEGLRKMEIGGEEYKTTVDGITKVADRIIKINEQKFEQADKDRDYELKKQQLEHDKRDHMIKNGIAIGTTAVSLLAYGITFAISRMDEREGIMQTSEGGRNALRNLLTLKFRK